MTLNSTDQGTFAICSDCAQLLPARIEEIADGFAACQTLDTLLNRLLALALQVSEAEKGNVQLLDDEGILRIRMQRGFSKRFLDFFKGVSERVGSCGSALSVQQAVLVENVEHSPIFADRQTVEVMLDDDARACRSTPIFNYAGRVIGVFSTHYKKPMLFRAEHESVLLHQMGTLAARHIERLALPRE